MKTLKELCVEALAVQDASNISGVVKGFDRAIADLKGNLPELSTEQLNTHPICVLWASKISSMSHVDIELNFLHAYDWAKSLSET